MIHAHGRISQSSIWVALLKGNHLISDPGEVLDVAAIESERFQTMLADYEAYALANGVLPIPKDFDLQKNALRFSIQYFLIPKLQAIAPWFALVLVALMGGWIWKRRRGRSLS